MTARAPRVDAHVHFWKYTRDEYDWIDESMAGVDACVAVRTRQSIDETRRLSGLATEADWRRWTPRQLHRYIDAALDSFGAERLMIGSDWPVCTVAGGYAAVLDVVRTALAGRTAAERDAVLGETARRFWNLSLMERSV